MERNPAKQSEFFLKGRMAESLVEELLRTAQNKVYRFGYESILQNLIQVETVFNRNSEVGQQIRSIPDFLVLNQKGQPFFVEVKFRSRPEWRYDNSIRELKRIDKFWKAKVVLVTLEQPYFRITNPPYFDNQNNPIVGNLVDEPDLGISNEDIEKFEPLIERYLISGNGSRRRF